MKVTLIYPSMGGKMRAAQMEPLTMAALAGLTPKDIVLSFWDDRIEDVPYDEPTDLVAISVHTFTAKRSYEIAAQFRQRQVPVVLGGFHASFLPDEALDHADAVVIGEAELLWPQVLADVGYGCLQKVYQTGQISSLQGLAYRREIFHGKRYLPVSLVEFGRGCPSACTFCSVSAFFRQCKRCRPVAEVIAEVRTLPHRNILFVDDNLIGDRKQARDLFQAMAPLNKNWNAQVSIDIAADDRLLQMAASSGCYGLMIGFESLQDGNLRQMGKSAEYNLPNFERAIDRIHAQGIKICASFLFGYDHDSTGAIDSTLAFALEKKFLLAFFCHLTPFPGTAFYNLLASEKRLQWEKWWLSPGYRWGDVVFDPKSCSAQKLSQGCRRNRRLFYSWTGILRRMFLKTNARSLLTSLLLNVSIRKDVFEKQGFLLGRITTAESTE